MSTVAPIHRGGPGSSSTGSPPVQKPAFEIDVLECPQCGGRMELIATIDDPAVVRKILRHLGLPTEVPEARRPRPPPGDEMTFG